MRRWLVALLVLLAAIVPGAASAHDFTPGVLGMVETADGVFQVAWTAPLDTTDPAGAIGPIYPPQCRRRVGTVVCDGGLHGAIAFSGRLSPRTKIVVTVRFRDGRTFEGVATSSAPRVDLERAPAGVLDWLALGMEHVLTGLDHLAFVVGLFLVVGRRPRRLVTTVTAFTIAHSITLALAALRVVELPRAPVEAAIAASVVLVAREALVPAPTTTRSAPWVVAFVFGLVHGLGFAAALRELPLPERALGVGLVSFNVGVEIAQLAVVGALLAARWAGDRAPRLLAHRAREVTCYVIGVAGVWWLLDRGYFVLNR